MATVSDTFNRANTSIGSIGSTDTGNLTWQNQTGWQINSNAAKNTNADAAAWLLIPNADAEVGIITGSGGSYGNGVGATFWAEDSSNYWIAYVHSEQYVHHQDCQQQCVGGNYTCTDCTVCGGGNTNPITYAASDTTSYVSNVGCGCVDTKYGTCSCSGSTPSRSTGNVNMTVNVCGDANCSQLSGNVADVCTIQYDYNPVYYNPIVPGNKVTSPGNEKGGNLVTSPGTQKGGNLVTSPGNQKGGNLGGGNSTIASNGGLPRTYNKTYSEVATYNGTNYKYNAYFYNAYSYNADTYSYNAYSYNAPTYSYNAYSYNAPTYSYNAPTGGNEAGGTKFSYYICVDSGTMTGPCTTSCTPVSNATDPCSGANCAGDAQTCASCGTTGKSYTRQCICTQQGGNKNACNTCNNCYDPCLTTQQVCTDVYYRRYKLKVDRISAGSRTNHYTSAAIYDGTSSTQAYGSIKVVTDGADYTATVYSDGAWTTSVATSGLQDSAQTDYTTAVGHGIGVAPLGSGNPGETDSIDEMYVTYTPLGGDSVGIIIA